VRNCSEKIGIDGFSLEDIVHILASAVDSTGKLTLLHSRLLQSRFDQLPNVNFHGTSIKFILMIMKALHSVLFVVFVSFILLH
jgi:hypothetical protein